MELSEITTKRILLEKEMQEKKIEFNKTYAQCQENLNEIKIIEALMINNMDVNSILVAKDILEIKGDPYGRTDDAREHKIGDDAVEAICINPERLTGGFMGNKRYENFYQRCDCAYGYGPKHGYICDSIGYKAEFRKNYKPLTESEKSACVYYIINYTKIAEIIHDALKP